MTETFDCVIFGAGPAGASAAYGLARAGYRVVAIAGQHHTLGCTGGVSPGVARLLDVDLQSAIDHTVRDVRYTWKNGDPVTIQLDSAQAMWMVQRDRFDALLRDAACKAGATIHPATATGAVLSDAQDEPQWMVKTDAESLTARYAIVADGACSEATHWIGGQRPALRRAAMVEVETSPDHPNDPPLVEFGLGQIENGLLWCFPKHKGVSIGAASFLGKDDPQLVDRLLSYTQSRGWPAQTADIRQRPIALWSGDRPLHADRAVIAGDAAGLSDPVTAEGIRPAIDSGLRAAEAIAAALANPATATTALATYTQTIHQTWGADFAWASRLSQILYRVPGLAYKVAVKKPIANQLMAQVLSGELRYSDIAGKAIAKLSKKLLPWG